MQTDGYLRLSYLSYLSLFQHALSDKSLVRMVSDGSVLSMSSSFGRCAMTCGARCGSLVSDLRTTSMPRRSISHVVHRISSTCSPIVSHPEMLPCSATALARAATLCTCCLIGRTVATLTSIRLPAITSRPLHILRSTSRHRHCLPIPLQWS